MRIDSDIANPDAALHVRFYTRPVKNNFLSEQEQREIWEDVDYVEIHVPGTDKLVIDRPVHPSDAARFPRHWAHFQNMKGGEGVIGTPISEWSKVSRAQAEQLKGLKFYTVESIANASDSQIQSIGMVAGMSPWSFREAAQRFLQLAMNDAEAAKKDKEVENMRKELEDMKAMLAQLTAPKPAEEAEAAPTNKKK